MMIDHILHLVREGLLLALWLSAPPVLAAVLTTLVTSTLQTLTQIQDSSLTSVPRLVAMYASLGLAAPWIGAQLVRFTTLVFESIALVG